MTEAFKWMKIKFLIEYFSLFWAAHFEHLFITEKYVTEFGFCRETCSRVTLGEAMHSLNS